MFCLLIEFSNFEVKSLDFMREKFLFVVSQKLEFCPSVLPCNSGKTGKIRRFAIFASCFSTHFAYAPLQKHMKVYRFMIMSN